MGLEAGTYISDLVATNPTGTDPRRQGDDHVRLIKDVLKKTFPNIDGAVNASQDDINKLLDLTNFLPTGLITMWSGDEAEIPAGWQLCDGTGTTSTGSPIPDLREQFVVGSTGDSGVRTTGSTGGSKDITGVSTEGHVLLIDEMPNHSHSTNYSNYMHSEGSGGYDSGPGHKPRNLIINSTGGDQPHSHDLDLTDVNEPPYYALALIIKL